MKPDIKKLEKFAAQIRLETLKEIKTLGFGHIGGSMSVVELLAVLYGEVMKYEIGRASCRERV